MKLVQTGNQRGSEHSKWARCTITNSITAWNKAYETRDVNGTGTPPHCVTLSLWLSGVQALTYQDSLGAGRMWCHCCEVSPCSLSNRTVTLSSCKGRHRVRWGRVTWLHDQLQITKSWVTALIQCLSQWHVLLLKPCGRGLYPGQVTPPTSVDCERKPRQGEHEAPTAAPLSHHNLIMLFKVSLWSCLKLKAFLQKAHMLSSSSYTN